MLIVILIILWSDRSNSVAEFCVKICGFIGSPTEHTTIPFDVDLNIGYGYDSSSGVFMSPASGVVMSPASGVYDLSQEALADISLCIKSYN